MRLAEGKSDPKTASSRRGEAHGDKRAPIIAFAISQKKRGQFRLHRECTSRIDSLRAALRSEPSAERADHFPTGCCLNTPQHLLTQKFAPGLHAGRMTAAAGK